MIKKLTAHPYAQAFVEINETGTYLWSYRTLVVEVEDGWVKVNGLYSATTRRHIGAFMKEYCQLTYQTAKMLYEDNYTLNLHTGEVKSLDDLRK
jgi:hypothetical protein